MSFLQFTISKYKTRFYDNIHVRSLAIKNQGSILLSIIILFQIVIGYKTIDEGHNWGGDFALYIDESEAIIDGKFREFYQQNLFTVNNSHPTLAPIAEPIVTPIILAPFIYFFGTNCFILKYLMLLCYIGISISLWKILNFTNINTPLLKFCTIFFIISYWEFAFLLETVNSDMPFLFFSLLSLLYFLKYTKYRKLKDLFLAISIGTICYFTRDAGAAMSLAYLFVGFIEFKSDKKLFKILLFSIPIVSIIIFKTIAPTFNGNLFDDNLAKLNFNRLIGPLEGFYSSTSENVLPLNRLYKYELLKIGIWIVIAFGTIRIFNSYIRTSVTTSFFLFFYSGYLSIYMLCGGLEVRFFLILEVSALILFCNGLIHIFRESRTPEKWIYTFFVLMSVEATAKDLVRINNWCFKDNYVFRDEVENPSAQETWQFINRNTNPEDIIFFRKPTVLRLYTNRNSCVFLEDSIFNNHPQSNFFQLDAATCGNVKNHLTQKINRDTIFRNKNFTLIKLRILNNNCNGTTIKPPQPRMSVLQPLPRY